MGLNLRTPVRGQTAIGIVLGLLMLGSFLASAFSDGIRAGLEKPRDIFGAAIPFVLIMCAYFTVRSIHYMRSTPMVSTQDKAVRGGMSAILIIALVGFIVIFLPVIFIFAAFIL